MNIHQSLCSLLIVLTMYASAAFSATGGNSGGGGNADAANVLFHIVKLSEFLEKNNAGLSKVDVKRVKDLAQAISHEMDDQNKTPIVTTDTKLKDDSGAPKDALFTKIPLKITVNVDAWKTFSQIKKLVTVGLELFGILGIPGRYDQAGRLEFEKFIISSMSQDEQLMNFILGSWEFVSVSCLSGGPVNWNGENPDDFKAEAKYNVDLTFSIRVFKKGQPLSFGSGTYLIQNASMNSTTSHSCRYDDGIEKCEDPTDSTSQLLLSIQNNWTQIWMLSNQGKLGGSCGPQDVAIIKFARQDGN